MNNTLEGVIIPTITTLDLEGNFDPISQKNLVKYFAINGVDGIFALGNTGECRLLDPEVKFQVMDTIADSVKEINSQGKIMKVALGIDGSTLAETVENTKYASRLGVDGVVLQIEKTPEINPKDYLETVLSSTQIPLYLHVNASELNGEEGITTENVYELVNLVNNDKISGIKIAENLDTINQYCKALEGTNFPVYLGNTGPLLKGFMQLTDRQHLIKGVISGMSNIFPEVMVSLWNLREEEGVKPTECFDKFNAYKAGTPGGKNHLAAMKYILHARGVIRTPRCVKPISNEANSYLFKESLDLL